ncbi:uncharacterized protein EHS24_000702 [Apiotrichum porosum]|uniref:Uncharacterized protein n=1 Tax=Apiotrichum porosum TaxID=105984 RepID=A0A427YAN4_9TREE|nr:uncharacterized protein EHS24_000702 [Apiotrichum porosum]RSH88173.1 hypothetical protein EHS24_000702 [Apiotrichum porosum]
MGTPDIAQDPFATTATRSYEGVYTAATTPEPPRYAQELDRGDHEPDLSGGM